MFKKYVRNILFIIWISLSYGCSLIPGIKLNLDDKPPSNLMTREEENALDDRVVVYQITPKLLDELHKQKEAKQQHLWGHKYKQFTYDISGYQYHISPGDILRISVWNQPDLQDNNDTKNSGVRVDSRGEIYFPFVGTLHVAGKTIAQVRKEITYKLKRYINEPQLDVAIASFQGQKVYVTGEVKKPGVQAIASLPLTVLDALNQAGGVTDRAVWNAVTLTRKGIKVTIPLQELLQKGNLRYNYLLKSGDVLHIPRDDKYQVILMGEVNKQRNISLGRYGMSLMEALGSVGGINEYHADATGIFVIRNRHLTTPMSIKGNEKIADVYQLDLHSAMALALGNQFELEPGDIIYVTAVPIARWNRLISNLMPSVSGLNSISKLVN